MEKKIKCPGCGQYEFEEEDDYDICPVCFWENDSLQNNDPDCAGGANGLSLNEYRKAWEEGRIQVPHFDDDEDEEDEIK